MPGRLGGRLRDILLIGIAVAAAGLGMLAYSTHLLRSLELQSLEKRFQVRGTQRPPKSLVVVGIDAATFERFKRYPFPRIEHARVIDRLRRDGARLIAYDVQFTEQGPDPSQDVALIRSVDRAPRVVLATTEVNNQGQSNIFGGGGILREIGAQAGNALIPAEPGGAFCRLPYDVDKLVSFAVAGSEVASNRLVKRSKLQGGGAWIDFYGPPGTIPTVPFYRVASGNWKPGFFRNKVVVVGATAPTLQDVHATCVGGSEYMSGPEIQATAISTVLRGFPLRQTPTSVDLLLILLLGILPPLGSRFLPQSTGLGVRILRALGLMVGGAIAYLVVVQVAFQKGWILPVTYPLLALSTAAIGALVINYAATALERAHTRELFGRFVPEAVVDRVVDRTDENLRLGGERVEATVLFSDIRGFTTFSESMPAEDVIKILNRYLEAMSDAILDHGGTLTTFIGDGIMAVFGAPIEQPDHADRALAAAREMLGPRLGEFNDWVRREEGLGEGFRMGVGLNSGPVMAGNVGSERRMDYTAIGDTVNTASRIEGMTKGTPHQLFLSDSTRESLSEEPPDLIYVEEMAVRGRRGKVKLWSIANQQGDTEQGDQVEGLIDGE